MEDVQKGNSIDSVLAEDASASDRVGAGASVKINWS